MKWILTSLILLEIFTATGKKSGISKKCSSFDNVEIDYTVYGKGKEIVLFVHGWSCDQTYWRNQIEYFKDRYKVVTMDLVGHGLSGTQRSQPTISSFGNDIVAVVNDMNIKNSKLYLVGHSMGGIAVLDAAVKLKERNIQIVIVDVLRKKFWPVSDEFLQYLSGLMENNFEENIYNIVRSAMFIPTSDNVLAHQVAEHMSKANPDFARFAMLDLYSGNYDELVKNIQNKNVNTVLINSDIEKNDEEGLRAMGFDQIITMQAVGHFPMLEKPDEFNRLLSNYLK